MKTILPWCVAVVLLMAGIYLFTQSKRAEGELADLRQRSQQPRQVQAEKEELKRAEGQLEELTRLRKENQELHRLRNEVRQLREQTQTVAVSRAAPPKSAPSAAGAADAQQLQAQQLQAQLGQLQAENERLRTENQAIQQARTTEGVSLNSCLNNLRLFEGAKEQWSLENVKTVGAIVNMVDIQPYFKGNIVPVCPAGGVYTLNPIGAQATCSVPGHALPPR
jgi:hypothetical protein